MTRGLFVTFEGPEGGGKSTQSKIFIERLRGRGYSVINPREPGGTLTGELIRNILQHDASGESLAPAAEALLFEASRAQLTENVIRPALDGGDYVVCDRFFDSTTAYQGYGRGFDPRELQRMNLFATRGLVPDLTFLCDIDVSEGLKRVGSRGQKKDTFEKLQRDFHERVRRGYLEIARLEPQRFVIIDASPTPDVVAKEVWQAYENRFGHS